MERPCNLENSASTVHWSACFSYVCCHELHFLFYCKSWYYSPTTLIFNNFIKSCWFLIKFLFCLCNVWIMQYCFSFRCLYCRCRCPCYSVSFLLLYFGSGLWWYIAVQAPKTTGKMMLLDSIGLDILVRFFFSSVVMAIRCSWNQNLSVCYLSFNCL